MTTHTETQAMCEREKRAPVQGYIAGIPWSMHLRAYDVYCKKYGPQDALIDLDGRGCRGGFSAGELDDFIPGWREELSELAALKVTITRQQEEIERLTEALRPFSDFARWTIDENGWSGSVQREQIHTWFGPSDFRAALQAKP